jgi:hypothetical protein
MPDIDHHPVDSTYYPCCRAIGQHGRACRVTRLDDAVNQINLLRRDLNAVLDSLPADAPLFACADLTTGICHLKRAAMVIDRAVDQLEADAQAAQR